jgi:hypothetical protein
LTEVSRRGYDLEQGSNFSTAESIMVGADKPDVVKPADDVICWLEHDRSIMLKAVTRFGDPVELTAEDALNIAASLWALADQLEPRAD